MVFACVNKYDCFFLYFTHMPNWLEFCISINSGDFPGGPVVKNPPSSAGNVGSIPGRGTKIPHAVGQLSPYAATTEPVRHN